MDLTFYIDKGMNQKPRVFVIEILIFIALVACRQPCPSSSSSRLCSHKTTGFVENRSPMWILKDTVICGVDLRDKTCLQWYESDRNVSQTFRSIWVLLNRTRHLAEPPNRSRSKIYIREEPCTVSDRGRLLLLCSRINWRLSRICSCMISTRKSPDVYTCPGSKTRLTDVRHLLKQFICAACRYYLCAVIELGPERAGNKSKIEPCTCTSPSELSYCGFSFFPDNK